MATQTGERALAFESVLRQGQAKRSLGPQAFEHHWSATRNEVEPLQKKEGGCFFRGTFHASRHPNLSTKQTPKALGKQSRFLKRTMVEKNGGSTPRVFLRNPTKEHPPTKINHGVYSIHPFLRTSKVRVFWGCPKRKTPEPMLVPGPNPEKLAQTQVASTKRVRVKIGCGT